VYPQGLKPVTRTSATISFAGESIEKTKQPELWWLRVLFVSVKPGVRNLVPTASRPRKTSREIGAELLGSTLSIAWGSWAKRRARSSPAA